MGAVAAVTACACLQGAGNQDTLKLNTEVAARFTNGKWYEGRISALQDGQYQVKFFDGDECLAPRGQIKVLLDSFRARAGETVFAMRTQKTGFRLGQVAEVRPDGALIRWTDGTDPSVVAWNRIVEPPEDLVDRLPANVQVARTEFARVPAKIAKSNATRLSPDYMVVAYREKVEGGWRVVVNGEPGPVYRDADYLDFSPVGHRLMYEAEIGKDENCVVVDGVPGPTFARVDYKSWSADGRHYIYAARRAGDQAQAVVLDGHTGPWHAGKISSPSLSPDGAHHAYVLTKEDPNSVEAICDGKPVGSGFKGFFSKPFSWSQDGSCFGLVAEVEDGQRVLLLQGEERARGSGFSNDDLALTADGRHWAVAVPAGGGRSFVFHDGKRYGPYARTDGGPKLSPDGSRCAYAASLEDNLGRAFLNGTPGPAAVNWYGISFLSLRPDGTGLNYTRNVGDKKYVLHLGDRTVEVDRKVNWLWLTPDGKHAAWAIEVGGGIQVIVDGDATEPVFREIDYKSGQFSPDGRHFVYHATRDRATSTVRLAGSGGRTYDVAAPAFLFAADGSMTFAVFDNGAFYRETWRLP